MNSLDWVPPTVDEASVDLWDAELEARSAVYAKGYDEGFKDGISRGAGLFWTALIVSPVAFIAGWFTGALWSLS